QRYFRLLSLGGVRIQKKNPCSLTIARIIKLPSGDNPSHGPVFSRNSEFGEIALFFLSRSVDCVPDKLTIIRVDASAKFIQFSGVGLRRNSENSPQVTKPA